MAKPIRTPSNQSRIPDTPGKTKMLRRQRNAPTRRPNPRDLEIPNRRMVHTQHRTQQKRQQRRNPDRILDNRTKRMAKRRNHPPRTPTQPKRDATHQPSIRKPTLSRRNPRPTTRGRNHANAQPMETSPPTRLATTSTATPTKNRNTLRKTPNQRPNSRTRTGRKRATTTPLPNAQYFDFLLALPYLVLPVLWVGLFPLVVHLRDFLFLL